MTTAATSVDATRPKASPVRAPSHRRAARSERLFSAVVAIGCLALLLVGSRLTPAVAGHGTHTQMGLPRCGWEMALGFPCATCGMTTSIAHASRGEMGASFAAQPFGTILAIVAASAFWIGLYTALTGSRLAPAAFDSLLQPRVLWWLLGAIGAAWAYKVFVWAG